MTFTIDGVDYQAGKLDAFQQLHVSRKLAGLLPKAVPALLAASGSEGSPEAAELLGAFEPAMEALSAMPEADVNYVFHTCLSVVTRKQSNAWSDVWSARNGTLMFADIDLPVMSRIVFQVLQDSLGPFIRGFLDKLAAGNPAEPAA